MMVFYFLMWKVDFFNVFFSSQACQQSHWKSGHKSKCKNVELCSANNLTSSGVNNRGGKKSPFIGLVPSSGTSTSRPIKQPKSVIFFLCLGER